MRKLICANCGATNVLVDGYDFGDRLLEGVMFVVNITDKGVSASVHPDNADYMKQLNEQYWIDQCIQYVEEVIEEDEAVFECASCGFDFFEQRPD